MTKDILNIVILNWNGWRDTQKCIESVLEKTKSIGFTICLVDNASRTDEVQVIERYLADNFENVLIGNRESYLSGKITMTSDFLSKDSPSRVLFIKNEENLGFACGNNIALEVLRYNNQYNVVLLNNDTELGNDAFSMMFRYLVETNVGAVIPQIRFFSSPDTIWNCGGSLNTFGVRKYEYACEKISRLPTSRTVKSIDFGTGCTLMFNIKKVGFLSERFFFGEEDVEFALRMKKMSLSIICVYDAVVYHKVGLSRKSVVDNEIGRVAYYYSQRIANLKSHLILPIWLLSVCLYMISSIRVFSKSSNLKAIVFFSCWYEIFKNVNKVKFSRKDFFNISNKDYYKFPFNK